MKPAHTSRQRYDRFRRLFRERRTEELLRKPEDFTPADKPGAGKPAAPPDRTGRRRHLAHYRAWLRPYLRALVLLLVLAALVTGIDTLPPLFLRHIIDTVLLAEGQAMAQRIGQLHLLGFVFLGVILVSDALGSLRSYRQKMLNARLTLALRRALHQRLLHLPLQRLSDLKIGGILSRLSGDVNTTAGLLQLAVISPGVATLRLLLALTIVFVLNWRLAAMALGVIPGIMAISFYVARRVRPVYRVVREDLARVEGRVAETFGGVRIVRAFRGEARERRDYAVGHHTVLRQELFAHRRELVLWGIWGFLMAAVGLVIVWYGGWLYLHGQASIGDILAFQWFMFLLMNPVFEIVNSFSELQRSLAATERVFEILAVPEDKPDAPDARDAPATVTELRFDHVSFEYRTGEPVVRDFDLVVPGGSVVALVGRSGAGKTTVTDLVARFHDPTQGQIRLNGVDLRQLRLKSFRHLLGVVQQEVFLFDGTVRENIGYGRRGATPQEVEDAARRANADEFIRVLPEGYDTLIGERGVKLSGGQRQRMAIARALLADPAILILDEATSNLDTESEQLIQASLAELLRGRTSFVIAHRLSTVTHADLIVVMEEGRIVERGRHADLMRARGKYFEMATRQHEAMASGFMGW